MPTKDEVIEKRYKRFEEGAQRLYKRIKEMPEYNTLGIRVKDIDDWIKRSHLTVKPKFYYKDKFNSFVAPGPKHTYQVDLFNFKYEQKVNFGPDTPTAGIIAVDIFTKETHIVPIKTIRHRSGETPWTRLSQKWVLRKLLCLTKTHQSQEMRALSGSDDIQEYSTR